MGAQPIRKAVIPAAGMGTRLLPFTRTIPKEMLPIAGKPLIQWAIEEAAANDIEIVVVVLSRTKGLIAEAIRELSTPAHLRTVSQASPRGLAEAIACDRSLLGDEPFAVILPDVLIDSAEPATQQLINCYQRHPGCIVATRLVEPEEVDRYGILTPLPWEDYCCKGRALRIGVI